MLPVLVLLVLSAVVVSSQTTSSPVTPGPVTGQMPGLDRDINDIYFEQRPGTVTDANGCPNMGNGFSTPKPNWLYVQTDGNKGGQYCVQYLGGECCAYVTDPLDDLAPLGTDIDVWNVHCSDGYHVTNLDVVVQSDFLHIDYIERDDDFDFPTLWTPTIDDVKQPLSYVGLCFEMEVCPGVSTPAPTTRRPTTIGVNGDPRFVGFNGERYSVTGQPNQVYNIMSDRTMQYQARFVSYGRTTLMRRSRVHADNDNDEHLANVTFIGEVGLKWLDAAGDEHRFHLNAYHPSLQRLGAQLLADTQDATGRRARSIFDRVLNSSSLHAIVDQAQRSQLFFAEFDGARIPLRVSIPAHLPPSAMSDTSSIPLAIGVDFDTSACAASTCRLLMRADQEFISLGGNSLPMTFYFSIVLSKHGEIYVNEKHEFVRVTAEVTGEEKKEIADRKVTLSPNVHGLLGYTFRASLLPAPNTNNNHDIVQLSHMRTRSLSSLPITTHVDHSSHRHEQLMATSCTFGVLDADARVAKRRERAQQARMHVHAKREKTLRHWELADEDAADTLEGSLSDYSPSALFADDFTFNQYRRTL